MKNLQLLVPHQECIFNCPFCISKTHKHENNFKNLYEEDYIKWQLSLEHILEDYPDLKNIVITGTSEPMFNTSCIQNMINIIREIRRDIQIEIQTRYYYKTPVSNQVDVLAYSISDDRFLKSPYLGDAIIRYVILLTKCFEKYSLEELLEKIPDGVSQITFKKLHDSKGYIEDLDKWISENSMSDEKRLELQKDILAYHGDVSLRYDPECMKAENRYMVFREDGNLYTDWESKEPIKRLLLF